MAPPRGTRGPGARAYHCCAGASFLELLLVVCCGRVLASHRMTVELLHIRIVARDRRPCGTSLTGGASFRRSPPFRYLPTLCCSPFLRAGPTLGDGSPLLRRSALRRCSSFWSRSFFPGRSRFGSPSLTLGHCHLLQGPRTLSRHASRQDRIAARMLTDPLAHVASDASAFSLRTRVCASSMRQTILAAGLEYLGWPEWQT